MDSELAALLPNHLRNGFQDSSIDTREVRKYMQVHPVLVERGNVPAPEPRTLDKPRLNELAMRTGTGRVPQAKRFCIRIKRQPREEAVPASIAPLEPEELKDALLMQAIAQRRALVNASLRPGTGREVKRAQFNIAIVPRARPQPLCFDSPLEENVAASEPAAPTTTSRLAHLAKTPAGLRLIQHYPSPMEGIPERLSGGQRGQVVASTAAFAGAAAAGHLGRPSPQGFTPVEGLPELRQMYLPARKPTPQYVQQQQQQGAVIDMEVEFGALPSARGSNQQQQQAKQLVPVAAEEGDGELLLAQEDELRLKYEIEMERQQRALQAQHEEELQRRQEELLAQYETLQAQHEELQHQHEELQHHQQGEGSDGLDDSPVEGLVQEHAGGSGSSVPPPASGGPTPMFDFPAPPFSVGPSSAGGSLPSGRALHFPSPLHRTEMGIQTGASIDGSAEKESAFGEMAAAGDYDDDDFGGGGYDDGGWGGPEDDDDGFNAAAADAAAMPPPPPRLKAPRRPVMNPGVNLRKQLPRRSLAADPQVGRQEIAPGVRRSTRKAVEPLKWWLNEAKIYDRVAHKTMPTVTEMTHTDPNTPWRMVTDPDRFDYKGRPKGRGARAAPAEGVKKKTSGEGGGGRKRKQVPQEEGEEEAGPSMPPVDHSDEETELLPRSARKPSAAEASPDGWSDDEDAAEGPARVTPARAIDLTRTPASEKPHASNGAGEEEENDGNVTMEVAGEDADEPAAAMDEEVMKGEEEGSPGASGVKLARTTRVGKRKKKKGGNGKGR